MTVKKEYICNFCRNTMPVKQEEIVGMVWHQESIKITRASVANNHLCSTCLMAIKDCDPSHIKEVLELQEKGF